VAHETAAPFLLAFIAGLAKSRHHLIAFPDAAWQK